MLCLCDLQLSPPGFLRIQFDELEPTSVVGRAVEKKLAKPKVVEFIEQAVVEVDGFQHVCVGRMSMVPRVALVKFHSSESRNVFVRFHKFMYGFLACEIRLTEDCVKDKALFKIKRAMCEISGCDGSAIIIDKPSKIEYRISVYGFLTEVAYAPSNTTIN